MPLEMLVTLMCKCASQLQVDSPRTISTFLRRWVDLRDDARKQIFQLTATFGPELQLDVITFFRQWTISTWVRLRILESEDVDG